jgi:signal transduction histidine kinase
MTLQRRFVFTSLAVALPVASVLLVTIQTYRTHEMTEAVVKVTQAQVTTAFRQRCEADPGAVSGGEPTPRVDPNSPDDVPPPRGKYEPRPFELFAYDDSFVPQYVLAPHFPDDFRKAIRSASVLVTGPFVSPEGTGVQAAVFTNWVGSPCRVLLARMRPGAHETRNGFLLFLGLFLTVFGVGMAVSAETLWRIQRTSDAARALASSEYRDIVTVRGHDEIGSLAFALNEAGADIRRRSAEAKDREGAFTRFVASTTDDTTRPFAALQEHLASADGDASLSAPARAAVRSAIGLAQDLVSMLRNMSAAAKLRMREEAVPRSPIELRAITSGVITQNDGVARAAGVSLEAALPAGPVMIAANASLIEQSIRNLIDNAIRYNKPGGHVKVTLEREPHAFTLRVLDDGQGVSDEELRQITSVRRFRGDEAQVRRPHSIGLGLAVVREACDRFDIKWTFGRPRGNGFEAVLSGKTVS